MKTALDGIGRRAAVLVPPSLLLILVSCASAAHAAAPLPDDENTCLLCHGNPDVWEKDTQHLFVGAEALKADIHWQKGLRCHDCHGGDPTVTKPRESHAVGEPNGLRVIAKPADVPGFCGHCHANADYMAKFQAAPKLDGVAQFWESAHGQHLQRFGDKKGAPTVSCGACHPKHAMRPAADPQSSLHPLRLVDTCGDCHKDQRTALRKGVHHAAGPRNAADAATPLDCLKCHGDAHALPPVHALDSPVHLENQVKVCGACHQADLATYEASLHGRGLFESGLTISAVCANCHGAHDIYYAADKRSRLHATKVAETCGKCHRFIDQRLAASVHGGEAKSGGISTKRAKGGRTLRQPSCTDCHQRHDPARPDSAGFRQQVANRCGNCHVDYAQRYSQSLHGRLTQLGYEPAAECADCHGAHDIRPLDDAESSLAGANRIDTCRQCHPAAVRNFAAFDPHADHRDAAAYPQLHRAYAVIVTALYWLFGLWALHAAFWFTRSLIHALRFGRHKRLVAQDHAIVRFAPLHRVSYILVVIAILGLICTGLPLEYSRQPWAQTLARRLGGFASTSIWHRSFALILLGTSLIHVLWAARRVVARWRRQRDWKAVLFNADSPVPNRRDLRDILGMLRWFFGLGRKPVFERWTYWEKFDYWAVYLTVLVLGLSGLMLWFPNLFCLLFSGNALNIAKVVHADTGLLVGCLLLIVHLFNTHFRPEKFPMDLSLVTGLVSEDHLRAARPEFLDRMQREGQLEALRVTVPSRRTLGPAVLGGLVVFAVGGILLLGVLLAALGK